MSEEERYEQLRQVCVSYRNEVADLEAKLAEKEHTIKTLIEDSKASKELLKKQLAEKEKEVEKWKTDYENCSKLEKLMSKERQYCLDNWRASEQDKISFAVEQLEKVKEEFIQIANNVREEYTEDYFMISLGNIKRNIDNQIKQLKEMK